MLAAKEPSTRIFTRTESNIMPANDPLWTAPSNDAPVQVSEELQKAYFRHVAPDDQRALGEKGRANMVQSHLELAVEAAGEPRVLITPSARHATV